MIRNLKRVILAPPYSGTLYAYFHDCRSEGKTNHTKFMEHPYYNNLYGMYTEQSKVIALTLSILYDEIVIPPADAYCPHDELGFRISWDEFTSFYEKKKYEIQSYNEDPELSILLKGNKDYENIQLLRELCYCIDFSIKYNCPIFCGKGTKKIIDRISTIEYNRISKDELNKISFIKNYINTFTFNFDVPDLDVFEKIKFDSNIREYSKKFIEILDKKANKNVTETEFNKLLLDSINTDSICKKSKGIFKFFADAFGVGGLHPEYGTPTSIASYASSGIGKIISKSAPDWYELAPNIEHILTIETAKRKAAKGKF